MSSLGQCKQCQGDLCIRGNSVACARCGLPVPEHKGDLLVAFGSAFAKVVPTPAPMPNQGVPAVQPVQQDQTQQQETGHGKRGKRSFL